MERKRQKNEPFIALVNRFFPAPPRGRRRNYAGRHGVWLVSWDRRLVQPACNAVRMESAFPFTKAGAVNSASEASLADITNRLCHFEHAQKMLGDFMCRNFICSFICFFDYYSLSGKVDSHTNCSTKARVFNF
jgi:hypothetical protein